jgi:hypothetical protein
MFSHRPLLPRRKRSNYALIVVVQALLCMGIVSCGREPAPREYVAKVDRSELAADDVASALGTTSHTSRRARAFVNDWITAEVLYQEAIKRGYAESDEIARQVEEARRRLTIAQYLQREVYDAVDTSTITDRRIAAYLEANASTLALSEDVARVSYILFAQRDIANAFRSFVIGGTQWSSALSQVRSDTLLSPGLLRVVSNQFATRATLFPDELWKLVTTLRPGDVSFPVRVPEGYYLLQLHSMKHQGEVPDIDFIRDDIRARLLMEERRHRYDQLVADLRSRHRIEIRLAPFDTTQNLEQQGMKREE